MEKINRLKSVIKRSFKSVHKSFLRNAGLSVATLSVIFLAIIIITSVFLLNPVSEILISNLKERVNISLYFEEGVSSEEILEIKEAIERREDVKEVEYISSEEAMDRFVERHKDNPVIMSSLTEIGTNPFLSSLNIRAYQIDQYEGISIFLQDAPFREIVNKVDYQERKQVIERVSALSSSFGRGALIVALFFSFIALLFAFNAIKLAIDRSKEEISIMKLVGASNWFIKTPFLIQGAVLGFLSGLLAFGFTFFFAYLLNGRIESFLPGVNLLSILSSHIFTIILIQFGLGILIGIISSFIAVKRYLF